MGVVGDVWEVGGRFVKYVGGRWEIVVYGRCR